MKMIAPMLRGRSILLSEKRRRNILKNMT
jgi:hypothetical protein